MSQLYVHESGSVGAPAVVLLHGAGVSGLMWQAHMVRLGAYHCLAPDMPGHGRSNHLPWTSLEAVADDVARLIESRVPAGRAHVVGLSVGGAIAHTLLATRPELLERVIIDGAGALPWSGRVAYLAFLASITPFLHTRPVIGMLSRSVGRIPPQDQAEIRIASRRAFFRAYRDALGLRATAAEVAATNPTLLVAGEAEKAVRSSNAALAAMMPDASARYVPRLGHGWLGTRLDLHVSMVEEWLAGRGLPDALAPETIPWSKPKVERVLAAGADDVHSR